MKRAKLAGFGAALAAATSLVSGAASAQVETWPSDSDWLPLVRDGVPIDDPYGDTNPGAIDIVGDAEHPAFYVFRDAENLYFRIRVDQTPLQGTSFRKFGWGCEIDVDGDLSGYDFIALLDGIISGTEGVTWLRNGEKNTDGSPNDRAERLLATEDVANYARTVSAGTTFPISDPDADFFVDFAIPIADIEGTPEASPQEPEDVLDLDQPLTFVCGTSANTATLNKDYGGPGTTLEELASDPVVCGEDGCTACNTASACGPSCTACPGSEVCDPATLTCEAACSTNGDCTDAAEPFCDTDGGSCVECLRNADCEAEEICSNAGACQSADADADGVADGDEEMAGSDPADADSDDDGVSDGAEIDWNDDSDGDGLINVLDPDSDDDGLFDGTEQGFSCNAPDTDRQNDNCISDGDEGATTTSPVIPDTDGGGVRDGSEDTNHNGVVDDDELDPNLASDDGDSVDEDSDGLSNDDETMIGSDPESADTDGDGVSDGLEQNPTDDSDGDGLINILDPDSDDDGLFDGTELGFGCDEPGADPDHCRADADEGATTTSPIIPDTDGGGVRDGAEDTNHDGAVDEDELDPNLPTDDDTAVDGDGDGLPNDNETAIGSNPESADSDGDGLPDGLERNPTDDTDNDGLINILDPDSDDDGLFDGTETGRGCASVDEQSPTGNCIPDEDRGTVTSVLDPDTDGGGVNDGDEDENGNGVIDVGERDPNDPSDDDSAGGAGGAAGAGGDPSAGGESGSAGAAGEVGVGGTAPQDLNQVLEGGGCDCGIPRSGAPWSAWFALGCIAVTVARRRRRNAG